MLSKTQRPNLPPSILSQKKEVFSICPSYLVLSARGFLFGRFLPCFNNLSPSKKNAASSEPASSGPS